MKLEIPGGCRKNWAVERKPSLAYQSEALYGFSWKVSHSKGLQANLTKGREQGAK